MASIFTKIIDGEIPSYTVAENDDFVAFLDIRPLRRGHTLVVPKLEVDYIFDHDDEVLRDLIVFSKKVALAVEKVVDCARIGVSVIGLEVPHTHVHLIPIYSISDMTFGTTRPNFSEEEMADTAAQISAVFSEQQEGAAYQDYLALILIYTANASDGISEEEQHYISEKVGPERYNATKALFDEKSEVEIIELIDELSDAYARENKEQVFEDIRNLIEVDELEKEVEENIFRMLKKLI